MILFFSFVFYVLYNFTINFFVNNIDLDTNNTFIIFREISKIVIITLLASIFSHKNNSKKIIFNWTVIFLISQILIVLLTIFLSEDIVNIVYSQFKNANGISFDEKVRYVGSLANPNYLSFVCCIFICLINKDYLGSTKGIFVYFGLAALIILTGSRTGLAALLIMSIILFIFRFKNSIGISVLSVTLVFFGLGAVLSTSERFSFLNDLSKLENENSYITRIELINESFILIENSPFFGYFVPLLETTDNLFLTVALRYGLIGLLIIVALMIRFLAILNLSNVQKVLIFACVFIFGMTGAFLDNPKILAIVGALLVYGSLENEPRKLQKS
jgi:hypothetical protein